MVDSLTAEDWTTISALPDDRPVSTESLATQLQVSRAAAARRIMRLRRLAVLRDVAVIELDRPLGLARSILRGGLVSSPAAFADFSEAVRHDPCVIDAAILSGRQDFEVTTLHPDETTASAYAEDFRRHSFVRSCERRRLSVLFSRPMTDGALLRPMVSPAGLRRAARAAGSSQVPEGA